MKKASKLLRNPVTAIALSILIGFIVGAIVLSISGFNPLLAYKAMFKGIFSKPKYIVNTIIKSTPIILTGLSVAFAFKTGLFNIGAEGQYIIGTIVAALVGFKLQLPPVIHFIVIVILAMLAAAIWGGFAGYLKAKFGIHEVITTIMLNWIALYLNNYIIYLPSIKKPEADASYEALQSAWCVVANDYKNSEAGFNALLENDFLRETVLKTDLNYGFLIAVAACIVVWFLLYRTTKGFELRSVGFNMHAAEFAGINVKKNIVHSMAISGAIAGLAGALQIAGVQPHRISILATQQGYGFNGISVALIANNHPLGAIFSGLMFGGLTYGGQSIQADMGAPSEVIDIMMGTIVFFIAMSSIFRIIADRLDKRGEK